MSIGCGFTFPEYAAMFPLSDPAQIRAKLEALCPPTGGSRGMRLSLGPVLFKNQQFFRIPMVHHGNISKVDEEGITLDMGGCADPHARPEALALPVIPPSIEAQGLHFSMGLNLRVTHSAIVDVWQDAGSEKYVNLWLRHAVVMAGQGWQLLPFLWPPETINRSR